MNLLLLNAALLPLAVLVAVPVILHLFARTRPPAYNFSSIEFILRIIRNTMRIKRPQDRLLLLLRTLLCALIVFLFLQPLFFSDRRLGSAFERKNVVLIVDATASMGCIDGAQTRFAAACAEASEILSGLSARDSANIVWLDSSPEPVFPEMGVNLAYLQTALRKARVSSEAGNVEEAFRLAERLLEGTEGKREICVVSDFQAAAWREAQTEVSPGTDLVNVKIGAADLANGTISDILCEPPFPLVDEETTVYCEVYNYSAQPRQRTVFLSIGEKRMSQEIMIPPWNKAVAIFMHAFSEPGECPIAMTLNEDAFAADDGRWAVVTVREALNVGILPLEPTTAGIWHRALDAVQWAGTRTISERDLEGELDLDALMLSGWSGANAPEIAERLKEGRTVVCMPGSGLTVRQLLTAAGADAPGAADSPIEWSQSEEGRRVRIVNEKADIFSLFAGGEYGDPCGGLFRGRFNVTASDLSQGELLLAYEDGTPALVRFKNRGHLYFWNLPLDPELSNWAGQNEFLPFLCEMLLNSRSGSEADLSETEFIAGQQVLRHFDRNVLLSDIALLAEDGKAAALEEYRDARGVTFAFDGAGEPALYEWRYQNKPIGSAAVNFPAIESDLRLMELAEIRSAGAIALDRGRGVRHLRDGLKLWPYLLAFALAVALIEGVTLVWTERT